MLSQVRAAAKRLFAAGACSMRSGMNICFPGEYIMRNSIFVASFTAAALAVGGCTSNLTGDSYSRDEARTVQTVRYGTIESLRPVKLEGTKTPIGGGAGAVVGGIAGSGVGGGRGSAVAAVIGAVAGAAGRSSGRGHHPRARCRDHGPRGRWQHARLCPGSRAQPGVSRRSARTHHDGQRHQSYRTLMQRDAVGAGQRSWSGFFSCRSPLP